MRRLGSKASSGRSFVQQCSRPLRQLPSVTYHKAARAGCASQAGGFDSQQGSRPQEASSAGLLGGGLVLATAAAGAFMAVELAKDRSAPLVPDRAVTLTNWSGTHKVVAKNVYIPESQQELQDIVAWAHKAGRKLRPAGTGLSPNGLAMEGGGMLSMVQLDQILEVDKEKMTITVEGGARVAQILDELKKHNMTLANFSSITEQQIGGWTQVAAHGTGARLPTVDEMITKMTLVTPAKGVLELSEDDADPELFRLARVALGSLGVVAKVTLKCVPRYTLHERTYTTTVDKLRSDHARLLQTYPHVRYMWLPFTDTVVVVVSEVAKPGATAAAGMPEEERLQPLRDLLREVDPAAGPTTGDNFAMLREKVLRVDPLNPAHVARVNAAEAEFWRRSTGERIADSTEILGFECGGAQWVLENCFPAGTLSAPSLADIDYVTDMKAIIEKEGIPAPCPIEQRWTACSSSPMSPAYSRNPDDIFSWVGVILYITPEEAAAKIKRKFKEYACRHADLTFQYSGCFHWSKLDLNFHEGSRLKVLRKQLRKRCDVDAFLAAQEEFDPKHILSNRLVDVSLAR
mmetsp:Transcript_17771/g.41389  ORF Transcript_17771/g.41389 Transcript_17771/m.41389 type:complete len:574 (+) Transcript_17771:66-1787(+)